MTIKLPDKPRKHRWVTEALNAGDTKLSVWPSANDFENDSKKQRFLETIARVGSDPRVTNISRHTHDEHGVVFIFDLAENG